MDGHSEPTQEFIDGLKVKSYLSHSVKLDNANKIARATTHEVEKVENNVIFYSTNIKVNTPARDMQFALVIIDLYTDVDIDFSNIISEFDTLAEYNLINIITSFIPEQEIGTFSRLIDEMVSDYITNEYELHSFVTNQVKRITDLTSATLEPVVKIVKEKFENLSEEQLANLGNNVDKMADKAIKKLTK